MSQTSLVVAFKSSPIDLKPYNTRTSGAVASRSSLPLANRVPGQIVPSKQAAYLNEEKPRQHIIMAA